MIDYKVGDKVLRVNVDSFLPDFQIYKVEKFLFRDGQSSSYLVEVSDENNTPCFFNPDSLRRYIGDDRITQGAEEGRVNLSSGWLNKMRKGALEDSKPKQVFDTSILAPASKETFEKMQAYKDNNTIEKLKQQVEDKNKLIDWFNESRQTTQGIKYDPDKLQYSLIPPHALEEVAKNLTIGLKKYPHRDNWKLVQDAEQRYLDALIRHLEAHRKGEIFDPDNPSVYHLAAVAVNAMFLLEFMTNPELDSKVFNKE